ncbi:hypothetical protein QUF86_11390 [Peribacillus sp. NJ11]|uniref:hypothetical protein n=1 Tax=Peribacillus sp. NJ11 TaxID=3055861 RepID=UPI0025A0F531|nr:hypothetical protein [Peribacillus sp. NJ11]MDM5221320.1 hypothetical protein [Peribacillus sp. NJ11]
MNNDIPLKSETPILGTDHTILDFWQWGFSKILTNNLRGIFAEFLIGTALGCLNQLRVEWDAFDLVYKGMKIEVKSSAYIQAWHKENIQTSVLVLGQKKNMIMKQINIALP